MIWFSNRRLLFIESYLMIKRLRKRMANRAAFTFALLSRPKTHVDEWLSRGIPFRGFYFARHRWKHGFFSETVLSSACEHRKERVRIEFQWEINWNRARASHFEHGSWQSRSHRLIKPLTQMINLVKRVAINWCICLVRLILELKLLCNYKHH